MIWAFEEKNHILFFFLFIKVHEIERCHFLLMIFCQKDVNMSAGDSIFIKRWPLVTSSDLWSDLSYCVAPVTNPMNVLLSSTIIIHGHSKLFLCLYRDQQKNQLILKVFHFDSRFLNPMNKVCSVLNSFNFFDMQINFSVENEAFAC